jgi:cytidylate kinase
MSIITISRGSYSRGKEIAEKVAERLGYECISRDIILEAFEEFNVPEIKLIRAIHDAPSVLDRLSLKKDKYIAYIRVALLRHFLKDNVVYHGLAGHFFVRGISHVLKVRIIANMDERIELEMEREGISWNKARSLLRKDDRERRKWSKSLYGIDTWDSGLYDLVIHVNKISVSDAVSIICNTVSLNDFQTTPESQSALNDVALSAEVRAVLLDANLEAEVSAEQGVVSVKLQAPLSQERKLADKIEKCTRNIDGIKDIQTEVFPTDLYGA